MSEPRAPLSPCHSTLTVLVTSASLTALNVISGHCCQIYVSMLYLSLQNSSCCQYPHLDVFLKIHFIQTEKEKKATIKFQSPSIRIYPFRCLRDSLNSAQPKLNSKIFYTAFLSPLVPIAIFWLGSLPQFCIEKSCCLQNVSRIGYYSVLLQVTIVFHLSYFKSFL